MNTTQKLKALESNLKEMSLEQLESLFDWKGYGSSLEMQSDAMELAREDTDLLDDWLIESNTLLNKKAS